MLSSCAWIIFIVTLDRIVTASESDDGGGSSSGSMVSYLSGDTALQMTIANLQDLTHHEKTVCKSKRLWRILQQFKVQYIELLLTFPLVPGAPPS